MPIKEMERLTRRQKQVYEFIRDKIRTRGYGPTVREIGTEFDISSPNGVMCHLKAFEKKGLITIAKEKASEEALMAAVLDAGADDMRDDGSAWEIVSAPDAHQSVVEAVKALDVEPDSAQIAMLPQNYIKLEGKQAQQMLKLMEALEDHDDTKNVWSNFDVEEQEIEASLA